MVEAGGAVVGDGEVASLDVVGKAGDGFAGIEGVDEAGAAGFYALGVGELGEVWGVGGCFVEEGAEVGVEGLALWHWVSPGRWDAVWVQEW